MPRGVGERLDPELRAAIEMLAAFGWRAPQIERVLGGVPGFRDQMPDTRTIQRYARRARRSSGPDEPWERMEMAGHEAALVFGTMAAVMQRTGHFPTLTRAQARWLLWVREAVPDLDPVEAWELGLLYFARERSKTHDYADLDALLAFAPWRSEEARSEYHAAVKEKRIPAARGYCAWPRRIPIERRGADASDLDENDPENSVFTGIRLFLNIGGLPLRICHLVHLGQSGEKET